MPIDVNFKLVIDFGLKFVRIDIFAKSILP